MFCFLHTPALVTVIKLLLYAMSPRAPSRYSTYSLLFSACCIAVVVTAILVVPEEARPDTQNLTILATSGMAFATSLLFEQRLKNAKHQMSAAIGFLSIGLLLWFVAEGVWDYYVYVLDIDVPYPSVADVFYIAAYLPVGYSLYLVSREASGVPQENRLVITTIAITLAAFIANVFILQIVDSAIGITKLSSDDLLLLVISIAYPMLDGFLFVPAIMALYTHRKRGEHFTWVLLSTAMLVMVAGDTGFGYTALVELEAVASNATWDILYDISYILLGAAMINGLLTNRKGAQEAKPRIPYFSGKDAASQ